MAKTMKRIAWISSILTMCNIIIYYFKSMDWLFSCTITTATISYHFLMRLLVGGVFDRCMKNQADYTKSWYQSRPWENQLYRALRVKKWKGFMPAYQSELFELKHHTWHEIAQAMCQAELVHETIMVFSFLPIFAAKYVGTFPVFLLTSLGAACFDSLFVIMQRYNRPRILRMIKHIGIDKSVKS